MPLDTMTQVPQRVKGINWDTGTIEVELEVKGSVYEPVALSQLFCLKLLLEPRMAVRRAGPLESVKRNRFKDRSLSEGQPPDFEIL